MRGSCWIAFPCLVRAKDPCWSFFCLVFVAAFLNQEALQADNFLRVLRQEVGVTGFGFVSVPWPSEASRPFLLTSFPSPN